MSFFILFNGDIMIEILKSYLKGEEYYIIQTKNGAIIINYNKIITLQENLLVILINNQKYQFSGNNFKILKSIDKSLEINGSIERIEKI